jgi:tetratricopeptide (TPR) repeat protein
MQRYYLALDAFRQALAIDPKYRDANIGYAYALFELGRYAEALPHLERMMREGEGGAFRSPFPTLSVFAGTPGRFYLGITSAREASFVKGVAARPDWAGLHNGLG